MKDKIKKEVWNKFRCKMNKKLENVGDNSFIQTEVLVFFIKGFNENLAKAIDLTIVKTAKEIFKDIEKIAYIRPKNAIKSDICIDEIEFEKLKKKWGLVKE